MVTATESWRQLVDYRLKLDYQICLDKIIAQGRSTSLVNVP